jgi:hypothetical protein
MRVTAAYQNTPCFSVTHKSIIQRQQASGTSNGMQGKSAWLVAAHRTLATMREWPSTRKDLTSKSVFSAAVTSTIGTSTTNRVSMVQTDSRSPGPVILRVHPVRVRVMRLWHMGKTPLICGLTTTTMYDAPVSTPGLHRGCALDTRDKGQKVRQYGRLQSTTASWWEIGTW